MKTVSCTHKNCTWSKTYPNDAKASQGLHGHVNRKHGTAGSRTKRKYTKRNGNMSKLPFYLSFCPMCGCNVALYNQAAIMASKMV